jgi:nanoRNase/pAp phosphatase (c-di-AMP/oligoRNAs hydrolase)
MQGRHSLLVVVQDFPDPDAIAAAAALKELFRFFENGSASVACGGFIARAENRALARYLDLNLLHLDAVRPADFDLVALVDTQPGTGNNALGCERPPDVVIDHHPIRCLTRRVPFYDIRSRYGATSTILAEYLREAGVPLGVPLATALVYGIRSDTHDLGGDATQADIDAYLALYPASNKRMIGKIEMERVPREYFALMVTGLRQARTYGRCIVSGLGTLDNPDMIGEIADLLLRNEDSTWVLCFGVHGGRMLLSLRTREPGGDAGRMARHLVGRHGSAGGHNAMSGGQIPLASGSPAEIRQVERRIVGRLLRWTGERRSKGEALLA